MKQLGNYLLKYRYLIAVVMVMMGVVFQFHGSSIGNWNKFGVQETKWGSKSQTPELNDPSLQEIISIWTPHLGSDGTILGTPRTIRSDEWMVQTSFYLSQTHTGNHLVNDSYALSGQNMVVAYNAPVKHISVIGKPFNWGFLFLGASGGLAWYWSFKLIFLLLLSYEFSMILTKKNIPLSLLGSLWITFTPAIQWWFMQHLGDVVFFSLAIIVAVHHYFETSSRLKKLGLASIIVSASVGFVLVIYPAFQVPFAFLIIAIAFCRFYDAIKRRRFEKFDALLITLTLFLISLIVCLTLYQSIDAIKASLNTVYPGHRVSTGGEFTLNKWSEFLLNGLLPFKTPSFSNQVELSSSYHFLPFIICLLPMILRKKAFKNLCNIYGIVLVALSIFLSLYAVVGMPSVLSKLSLMSYVTSSRAWQAMSVTSVFASIWFISYLWEHKEKINPIALGAILTSTVAFIAYQSTSNSDFQTYAGGTSLIIFAIIFGLLFALLLWQKKVLFYVMMLGIIVVSGFTVNPLVHGIGVIENKKLSIAIQKIVQKDKDALWMTDSNSLYNFPQMFGARSIDGVRFYPDTQLMKKIDTKQQFTNKWNRYAHIRYQLTDAETTFSNPYPDNLSINLRIDSLKTLHVSYILSQRNLQELFGEQEFELLYQDADGNKIFKYRSVR